MQDKNVNENPETEPVIMDEETAGAANTEPPAEEETGALKKADKKLSAIENELSELKDRYMRTLAEYDNYRKRSVKERENTYSDAYAAFAYEILPVLDNLERAEQFGGDTVSEGVKLILSQFRTALDKLGVCEIKAQGEVFDPNLHNAVMHEEDEAKPANTVSDVLQKGYRIGERVIRASMVKVVN